MQKAAEMLAFLHVPKTAGTSFATVLHRRYGDGMHEFGNAFSRPEEVEPAPPGCEAAAGHITIGLADRLAPGATLATLLRDPVTRTLSQHRYLAGGRGLGFVPPGRTPPAEGISLRDCLEGGYILDNMQTRMLCGIDAPFEPLPADALDRAVANLSRFAYLGLTERFDEFLALVAIGLGWPTIAPLHARPGVSDGGTTAEDIRLAEAANELDLELYARAVEVVDEAAAGAGTALLEDLAVMRAQAGTNGARPRSLLFEARVELAQKERELVLMDNEVRRLRRKLKLWRLRAEPKRRRWRARR